MKNKKHRKNTAAGFVAPENRRAVFVSPDLPPMIFVRRDNEHRIGKFIYREDYPDGQLCPYEDCGHDLAIPEGGWWVCGHCERMVYADVADSDYEDYHTFELDEAVDRFGAAPDSANTAEDLGPSWATPEEARDKFSFKKFVDMLKNIFPDLRNRSKSNGNSVKDRALSMPEFYMRIDQALYETFEGWPFLHDLYMEEDTGSFYAIFSNEGRMYRSVITYSNSEIGIGDAIEVVVEHVPVDRQRMIIRQQADGSYRFFLVAASAVLNRVGEIDSTTLFDNMIKRAEETGEYPVYIFYHMLADERFRLGAVDYLARDDYLYVASGVFDETPLAVAARIAIETEPDYWGNSIGYLPLGTPEKLVVGDDIVIPVYTDGVNREISLCPEGEAAAYYTSILVNMKERTEMAMSKRAEDALRRLFKDAGEEELAEEFLTANDSTNRSIEGNDLIRRTKKRNDAAADVAVDAGDAADADDAGDDGSDEDGDDVEPVVAEDDGDDVEVELDESALTLIAAKVAELPVFQDLTDALSGVVSQLTEVQEAIAASRTADKKRFSEIESAVLELAGAVDEEEQIRTVDQPRSKKLKVTTRPRVRHAQADEDDDNDVLSFDSDEYVNNLLDEKIPAYPGSKNGKP